MMKTLITLLILTITLCANSFSQIDIKITDVDLGYAQTSVNTAIFRENAITTCRDTQFIAFYDPEGFLVLGKRAIKDGNDETCNFTLQKSQYKIQHPCDAHNVISIAADGDGYLHVAFDSHLSQLKYCRSVAPYCLTLGPLETMLYKSMEKDVTYPAFYNFSNGDLLFVYRNVHSIVMNHYYLQDKCWRIISDNILENNECLCPYWQITIDKKDRVHISWLWRDNANNVDSNHDIYYAYSTNYGFTWKAYDGKLMKTPFTRQNTIPVVNIPTYSNLINQTSIAVDSYGRPYIATYYRKGSVTNYHLIYYDGKRFNDVVVGRRNVDFRIAGIGTLMLPIARPAVVCDDKMIYYIVRDKEDGSLPTMFCSEIQDGQKPVFDCMHLSQESLGAWEPIIDHTLWQQKHLLHLFVQETMQISGDRCADKVPTMVKVLEMTPFPSTKR